MPTQWTLDLALDTLVSDNYRYDVLHALACTFFEQSDADHDADNKPFTVRLAQPTPAGTRLTLAWLRDDPPPATVVPTALRLGPRHVDVIAFRADKTPLNTLGGTSTAHRIHFEVTSPTKFRHNGSDYPLPDPYLTYAGLARRLHVLSPNSVDVNLARSLARSIVIYRHDIHTEAFTWHGSPSAGFTGSVTFGIPTTSPLDSRRLFIKLTHFATIAGVGHGTTHGLGAVQLAKPRVGR